MSHTEAVVTKGYNSTQGHYTNFSAATSVLEEMENLLLVWLTEKQHAGDTMTGYHQQEGMSFYIPLLCYFLFINTFFFFKCTQ